MFKKPVMYLRDSVMFPETNEISLIIGRENTIKSIELAQREYNQEICIITQVQGEKEEPEDTDIFPVGTICKIVKSLKFSDGTRKILVRGLKPFNVKKIVYESDVRLVEGEVFDNFPCHDSITPGLTNRLKEKLKAYNPDLAKEENKQRLTKFLNGAKDLEELVGKVSQLLASPYSSVQKRDELEKIKRDLDYWKSMEGESHRDIRSRIGKRVRLLTALPANDKLNIIEDILREESSL